MPKPNPRAVNKQRRTVTVDDLIPQTHEGANEALDVDTYWLGPNGEIEAATFLLGDLCTWDYERCGYRLMQDKRQTAHA